MTKHAHAQTNCTYVREGRITREKPYEIVWDFKNLMIFLDLFTDLRGDFRDFETERIWKQFFEHFCKTLGFFVIFFGLVSMSLSFEILRDLQKGF